MRASETEPAAAGAVPRRPSIVPSLKLTESERTMLGLSSLPTIDAPHTSAVSIDAAVGPPLVMTSPASPAAGPAASAAQEEVDRLLPGTAVDVDDGIATGTPRTPTALTTPAATTSAYTFEPFRGRWHYGQPVLARYRNTPNFYSGNIATYLGAGLFMVVFDDGTLDYRVRREDLMILTQDESVVGVVGSPSSPGGGNTSSASLDASASLAPPNHQLMVDFSASPPRQVILPVDGGFGGRQEDEQDEFYVRYPHLCPSQTTVVSSLHDSAADMVATLPPSIPDETVFMKQLENGVAFEEDSTQVSDSDDSDGDDMDDGGELMTPWQQMTQTFGMKTLRPRATRRSSVSSVSQVERMSNRLTKQGSVNNVLLSPKSFKQMISDYLSKHSKKVTPSGSQKGSSIDGSAGRVELTPQEWLEQMLTRLDASEHDGAGPAATADHTVSIESTVSGGSGESAASSVMLSRSGHGHGRAVPTPVTLPSAATTAVQRVVYERRADGTRAYGTVKARLASGDFAVVTEDEQMITVQAFPPSALLFLPSTTELARQVRCLGHGTKELYAGRRVQVTLYPGSRFSGNGLIVVEKRRKHGASSLPRRQSTSTPVQTSTSDGAQQDPDHPIFHVLLQNRIRLHNVPADKLIPMMEKHRRQAGASITDDQFLICSNKTKVFIGDQVLVKCAGDAEGATTEEKVGVLNGVYSNRTAAIDFADGSTGYEVLPHRISKRKKPRYPHADQDVLSLKNAVLMQARSGNTAGNGNGNGSGSSTGSGSRDHASHRLPHPGGEVDYSPPYDTIEEGFQVMADHPRRATVEKCVVIKTHPSSACDLRFADGTISFEVFPSQMVLEGVDRRRRQRRRSRSRLRLRRTRSGRAFDETEDEDEDEEDERNEWEPRVGEYVLAWSSRFGRFCSAKVSGRAASSTNASTGPIAAATTAAGTHAAAAPPGSVFFSVVFDYGELRANVPIERLARIDDADVLLPTQKLTNYSIDTMGFELWSVGFSVGEAVMARVHGSATYFPGVVEYVYDSTAGNAGNSSSNSGSLKARRGSNTSAHVGPRVCGVLFDSGERDPRVPFTSAFSVDPRHRFLHSVHTSNTRGSSSSGKGNHGATRVATNGVTIALGLGLGGVSIASNDPLMLQADIDGGGATQRTTSAVMMPSAISGDCNSSAVSPTHRHRRVSNPGSVGSMIMSMAGSFFGRDEEGETNPRRASQLLTEIGARLMRRRSSS